MKNKFKITTLRGFNRVVCNIKFKKHPNPFPITISIPISIIFKDIVTSDEFKKGIIAKINKEIFKEENIDKIVFNLRMWLGEYLPFKRSEKDIQLETYIE